MFEELYSIQLIHFFWIPNFFFSSISLAGMINIIEILRKKPPKKKKNQILFYGQIETINQIIQITGKKNGRIQK